MLRLSHLNIGFTRLHTAENCAHLRLYNKRYLLFPFKQNDCLFVYRMEYRMLIKLVTDVLVGLVWSSHDLHRMVELRSWSTSYRLVLPSGTHTPPPHTHTHTHTQNRPVYVYIRCTFYYCRSAWYHRNSSSISCASNINVQFCGNSRSDLNHIDAFIYIK